jgi:hypothetical protein
MGQFQWNISCDQVFNRPSSVLNVGLWLKIPKFFRSDAAFASPKLLHLLEGEGYWYAIRLKANAVLERHIAHLLKRPVGRPSKKPKVFYSGISQMNASRAGKSAPGHLEAGTSSDMDQPMSPVGQPTMMAPPCACMSPRRAAG